MTHPYTLSVVTPVLNGAEHLTEAMRSVREAAALGASIEHIIVDGGSTDGSAELAASERERSGSPITHILTGTDTGQAQAINRGFCAARGRYLGWLNADDYFLPAGLAQLVSVMQSSEADVVLGRCSFVNQSGTIVFAPKPPEPVTPESLLRLLSGWFAGRSIVQPEAFIRSDAFQRMGGVEEALHYTMDHNLWLRFSMAGASFKQMPIDVARQLVHSGQKTADNEAVVAEMLGYAMPALMTRPESAERSIAESELIRVRSRLERSRAIKGSLVPFESLATELAMWRQSQSAASEALIHRIRSIAPRRPLVLLAGLRVGESARLASALSPHSPPTIAGRLPMSVGAFDIAIVRAEALDGLPAGFDLCGVLRSGGVLCLLGVLRSEAVREQALLLAKALGDAITVNEPGLLDDDIAVKYCQQLRESRMSIAGISIGQQRGLEFIPDTTAKPGVLFELSRRYGLLSDRHMLGTILLRIP